MHIKDNPFVSDTFITTWLEEFKRNKPVFSFNLVGGLRFYKSSYLPIYINAGRNHTKGISYSLNSADFNNLRKSVVLIYDVPNYVDLDTSYIPASIKSYRVKQYPGFLVVLNKYQDINDYLKAIFSKKTRSKLSRYEKRLEHCFDVKYKMYYGDISKDDYNNIFETFRYLLEKRFSEKQIRNNNLDREEWDFYYNVSYALIKEKKASLFVVYQGNIPIAITLNYLSENILFHGITVFDVDYSKFHLGKVALKNLFVWCFENNIQYFDFSKGYFDYKTHWSNLSYNFEYHLLYDRSSIPISLLALAIKQYFKLKQYLRDKNLNNTLHRLTYLYKKKHIKSRSIAKFNFYEISKEYKDSELIKINILKKEFKSILKIVNEFLFLYKETLKDLIVLKVLEEESTYIFKGKKLSKLLVIE